MGQLHRGAVAHVNAGHGVGAYQHAATATASLTMSFDSTAFHTFMRHEAYVPLTRALASPTVCSRTPKS